MKIVCISDVHTYVDRLEIEECDMLLCAGDISYRGKLDEVKAFLDWFEIQPAKHKVFIAGNHDFLFENDPEVARALLKSYPDVIYLENSSVEIEGIKIWGSPWTPWFHSWAFNAYPEKIRSVWSQIPDDTDILITHGPPKGVFDLTEYEGENVGCPWLLKNVERIKPKLHVFGHIHEGYGQRSMNGTHYVNAANCTISYGRKPLNPAITIEYER